MVDNIINLKFECLDKSDRFAVLPIMSIVKQTEVNIFIIARYSMYGDKTTPVCDIKIIYHIIPQNANSQTSG